MVLVYLWLSCNYCPAMQSPSNWKQVLWWNMFLKKAEIVKSVLFKEKKLIDDDELQQCSRQKVKDGSTNIWVRYIYVAQGKQLIKISRKPMSQYPYLNLFFEIKFQEKLKKHLQCLLVFSKHYRVLFQDQPY